jgi:hypothetical protein
MTSTTETTTWLPRMAGTGGIRPRRDGDRQLLGHLESREPAVKGLTEVGDSLLPGLALALSAATGQRRVRTPPAGFILLDGGFPQGTSRRQDRAPAAYCPHARRSRAPPPGWPGRLKPRLPANRGMPAGDPRRATLDG